MEESGWIKITDIKPHPENSRNHDDKQIKKIAASIDKLGWGRPIIISCDNYILAGHGAYLAAQDELNLMSVPFKRMEHKHDAPEAIAYMIADNKLTDDSDWNYGKLELNFEELELKGFDLELTGFNNTELKEVETKLEGKKEVEEDDFDPESVKESIVQHGDVWQLGNHKLMCGDSTNKEDVLNLLNDNKVDMVFTDPPYDFEDNSYFNSLKDVANEIFVMCSDKYLVKLANQYLDIFRYFFTVELSPAILINSKMPMTGHDLIAYFRTGKSTMNNLRDAFSTHIKLNKRKDGEHRHEKRLELPSNFIQHYTIKNGTVLDIFGGSGSTLMACEQLQRKCYMMELEPHNCDIIIARWEEFTGEKAKKINN